MPMRFAGISSILSKALPVAYNVIASLMSQCRSSGCSYSSLKADSMAFHTFFTRGCVIMIILSICVVMCWN